MTCELSSWNGHACHVDLVVPGYDTISGDLWPWVPHVGASFFLRPTPRVDPEDRRPKDEDEDEGNPPPMGDYRVQDVTYGYDTFTLGGELRAYSAATATVYLTPARSVRWERADNSCVRQLELWVDDTFVANVDELGNWDAMGSAATASTWDDAVEALLAALRLTWPVPLADARWMNRVVMPTKEPKP